MEGKKYNLWMRASHSLLQLNLARLYIPFRNLGDTMKLSIKRILHLMLLSGLATGAFAQSAWTSGNPVPTASILFSIAWTGTLHVAVGDSGALLTSPEDPASISPRMRIRSGLSLRLTASDLFITPPSSLHGQKTRAAIYTQAGGKSVDVWTGTDREFKIPLGGLAHGQYVFELRGLG